MEMGVGSGTLHGGRTKEAGECGELQEMQTFDVAGVKAQRKWGWRDG